MDIFDVILGPLVTEKANGLKTAKSPKLSFFVHPKSTKGQIKTAFYYIYGIAPTKINTLIRKPQPTRNIAKSKFNFSKTKKIAYITLPKDINISNAN